MRNTDPLPKKRKVGVFIALIWLVAALLSIMAASPSTSNHIDEVKAKIKMSQGE